MRPGSIRNAARPLAVLVGLLAVMAVAARLAREPTPPEEAADPAARAASDAERRRRIARREPAVVDPPIRDAPCPVALPPPPPFPRRPITGEHLPRGTDLDHQLRRFLRTGGYAADVLPLEPGGVGPLREPQGWADEPAWTAHDHQATLLVQGWEDPGTPTVGALGGFEPGALTGRLVLWRFSERRVVCAARVDVQSSDELTIVEGEDLLGRPVRDDPLTKARLDLVRRALERGAAALRATAR
ncbi:MAG TPA: hypothetical protein RMH99_29095 [Sandaracinaceae bacterium LLY-WYZ-13_1]|nr:hypothetical protein [Sandaracinaceae bacterium LLY-WYZ-13_1]